MKSDETKDNRILQNAKTAMQSRSRAENKVSRIFLTPERVVIWSTFFIVLSGNFTFFSRLNDAFPLNFGNALFALSVACLLASLIVLVISIASLLISARIVSSVMILVTAVSAYYMDQFGVVIDADMLQNVLQTNTNEALDLLSLELIARIVLLGVLPVICIWRAPYVQCSRKAGLGQRTKTMVAALIMLLVNLAVFNSQYASFFREYRSIRYYANPIFPIHALTKTVASALKKHNSDTLVELQADPKKPLNDPAHELVILVVGETARSDHFSLNGYTRNTNPLLAQEERLMSFGNIESCGTSTAVSVPCMFAISDRKNFDGDEANRTENVLDVLTEADISVLWRDNNSSSKGVATRVQYQDFKSPTTNSLCDPECRDEGMLDGLQEYIDSQTGDILIVLHQMGSHGPAYYKRYPDAFHRYQPACRSNILSDCSDEEIINAYDNTILYTDYFLSKVISLLKANSNTYETAMIYVSDHGESLGEFGIYLHGLPRVIAPDTQLSVPLIIWAGASSDVDIDATLKNTDKPSSHDALSSTLLGIFEVSSNLEFEREATSWLVMEEEDG